jgi:hypothetical protein
VYATANGTKLDTSGSFNPFLLGIEPANTLFTQLAVQGGRKGGLLHNTLLSHFTREGSTIDQRKFGIDIAKIGMTDSRKGFITLRADQWFNRTLTDERLNSMPSSEQFYGYMAQVTNNSIEVRVSILFTRIFIWFARRPPSVCMRYTIQSSFNTSSSPSACSSYSLLFSPLYTSFHSFFAFGPFGGLSRGRRLLSSTCLQVFHTLHA